MNRNVPINVDAVMRHEIESSYDAIFHDVAHLSGHPVEHTEKTKTTTEVPQKPVVKEPAPSYKDVTHLDIAHQ